MSMRAVCLLSLLPWSVSAQVSLLPQDALRAFELSGTSSSNYRYIQADHPDFQESMLLTTPAGTYANEYDVRVRAPIAVPVKKGDLIGTTFWVRSQQDKAYIRYVSEQVVNPYTKSSSAPVIVTPVWQRISL